MPGGSFVNDDLRRLLFLPSQASTFAAPVDHLHFFVIVTSMLAASGIGLTALLFVLAFRRRTPGRRGRDVVGGWTFHLITAGVPLGFFLLWYALGISQYLEMQSPPEDAMEVYVLAKQWMWKFNYSNGPVAEAVLHVPVGRPVKLLMTSRDVIHSFYVPAFRVKRDVLPGRYTELWFQATAPGSYEILCTQYCGTNHSLMRGEVVAMPPEKFDAWFAEQARGLEARNDASASGDGADLESPGNLVVEGQRVAAQLGCFKCHSVDGTPHIGPTWLGLYRRREVMNSGETLVVDEPYMTESMMDPAAKIVAGFAPVMPSFQGRISPAETAAILEYIKSLRDLELQAHASKGPVYELRSP